MKAHNTPLPLRRLLCAAPVLAIALTGGCAGVTGATLGTIVGALGSAVGTGKDIYGLGKLDTVEMASAAETEQAVHKAADDLHLTFKCQSQDEDHTIHLKFVDDKCAKVAARIEARTQAMVRLRIDVGLLGSEPTARLFLARVRGHLPAVANPVPREPAS